jgi:phage terminase large subunit
MAVALELEMPTPRWALPLLPPARYKGAKGGRSSGKSHFFAEMAVERMVTDPALRLVCIREVQRSLKFSAKSLIEKKIQEMGVSHLFTVLTTEIRRNGGTGVMIFEGMQDHTADSIKSLEGFAVAWCEEAQALSKRSLALLLPTIRAEGSELWFSWNPELPTDPVDQLFAGLLGDALPQRAGSARSADAVVVHVNYLDNPFCPQVSKDEAARMARVDTDAHEHTWLGGYNTKSDAKVLNGKWIVDEFEPQPEWDGPYHGADFGFAQDPNTLLRMWIAGRRLMVEYEAYRVGQDTDEIPPHWQREVPRCEAYVIRADSSRPETISYLKRHGLPRIVAVPKWKGSVEDGIAHLRQYERIVIHPRCVHAADEARHYSYKVDAKTGDVLPEVIDKHNHIWDAARYGLAPLIKARSHDEDDGDTSGSWSGW